MVPETVCRLTGPVVVRSPNWLGDAIMALPAVRNLKTLLASEPLTVATPEKLAALWEACPFVDRVISLSQPKKLWTTARELRAEKFGTAVLLPNSLRSATEALLARIPQRVGYNRGGRQWLLTLAVPVPARDTLRMHQRYYYQDLATKLGAPPDESMPKLKMEPAPSTTPPTVAICPGAEYGPAKRWPLDRFAAVARHFQSEWKAKVVVLGAAGDAAIAQELATLVPEAENRAGKTTLAEFMAALAGSQLVICNDSGAMHLASALGVPTVAIFGSTEPQLTGPMGLRTRVLRHHVPCSPCFRRECPLDFACMLRLSPELAIAAGTDLRREAKS